MPLKKIYTPKKDSYLLKNYLSEQNWQKQISTLDIGTGTGIIALEMAKKGANVTAIDINEKALEYAEKQAKEKQLDNRITFKKSDLYSNVSGKYDLITFNPPYLPSEDKYKNSETWRGGKNGTEITEKMLKNTSKYLKPGGEALVILSNNSKNHREIMDTYNLEKVKTQKLWFEKLILAKYR